MAQEEMSCVKAKVPEKNTLNRLGFFEVAIESIVANVAFTQVSIQIKLTVSISIKSCLNKYLSNKHLFETTRQITVYEPSHYV